MGNICLHLSLMIAQLIKGKTIAKDIWGKLKAVHSQMTLDNAYIKFKGIINTYISNNQALNAVTLKVAAYVEHLEGFYILVNNYIHLMLLLLKTLIYVWHIAMQYSIS